MVLSGHLSLIEINCSWNSHAARMKKKTLYRGIILFWLNIVPIDLVSVFLYVVIYDLQITFELQAYMVIVIFFNRLLTHLSFKMSMTQICPSVTQISLALFRNYAFNSSYNNYSTGIWETKETMLFFQQAKFMWNFTNCG